VRFIDLRFVDLPGHWQHITLPAERFDESLLKEGRGFDGSSINGFQDVHESDMLLLPEGLSAFVDPFMEQKTLVILCNIVDPVTRRNYPKDPRYIAWKAEKYLRTSGVGDVSYWGPEAEFFLLNDLRFDQTINGGYYHVDSNEGSWNMGREESPNLAYKIRPKGGYFPIPPMDSLHDMRSEMTKVLQDIGIKVEGHHHESATGGQAEISIEYDTLVSMADKMMKYKYVVKNTARRHGMLATFMPKPLYGDSGSGLHVHQSIFKGKVNTFYDEKGYAGCPRRPCSTWGASQARFGALRHRQSHHELLQAPDPGVRGAFQPHLQPAQSFRRLPHPPLLQGPEGQTRGVPHTRPFLQPVLGLRGHLDGRSRRDRQQDRPGRALRREHL
jgi:glutamine synthetase